MHQKKEYILSFKKRENLNKELESVKKKKKELENKITEI